MKSWWPIKKNNRLYHKSFQDLSGGRSPSLLACFNLGIHFFLRCIFTVCAFKFSFNYFYCFLIHLLTTGHNLYNAHAID